MKRTEDLTRDHKEARLNVCLCYNSKWEILKAFDDLSQQHAKGQVELDKDGEFKIEDFEKNLYGEFNCKPEVLIRTSNEVRLSNFLLY